MTMFDTLSFLQRPQAEREMIVNSIVSQLEERYKGLITRRVYSKGVLQA